MNPPVPIRSSVRRTRLAIKVSVRMSGSFYSSCPAESRGQVVFCRKRLWFALTGT